MINPLFLSGRVKGYIAKLLELLDNPELIAELSATSREHAVRLSWENISAAYSDMYHDVLKGR